MNVDLKGICIRHLGKKANKYWKGVTCDIIAVHQGVKPGFLYDYGVVTPSCLASLVSDVIHNVCPSFQTSEEKMRSIKKLCIITLVQDVILVNTTMMQHTFDELENKMTMGVCNIIDISEKLSSPEILSLGVSSAIQLKQDFRHFYTQYKTNLRTDDMLCHFELDDAGNVNLSTMFGLLIGYPVLYWYEGGPQASNCLGMVSLVVYQVLCDVFIPTHYCTSQTQMLNKTNPITNKASYTTIAAVVEITEHSHNMLKSGHILFSFSIPECVCTDFDEAITLWFQNIQDGCSSLLIKKLQLSKKSVTLPSVVL